MIQTFPKHLKKNDFHVTAKMVWAPAAAAARVHVGLILKHVLWTPSQHRLRCRILFHLLVFQIPCPLHHPILALLFSSSLLIAPLPTPPFIPLLALPPAAASKPLTASGEMADWKCTSCPSIIWEVGGGGCRGGVHGGKTGGTEREKQSGIKKGEGKDNLRDRHRHKSPERGSKRLLRIWRQSNVGSDEGKRLRETFKESDVQVISADTCTESFTAGSATLMFSKQGPGTKLD